LTCPTLVLIGPEYVWAVRQWQSQASLFLWSKVA
jgi:hypothetical protein